MRLNKALEEISSIERIIKPYKYQVYEAEKALNSLADLREALSKMDKKTIENAIEKISELESQAEPYRGYEPVERALIHARRLREELRKLLGD